MTDHNWVKTACMKSTIWGIACALWAVSFFSGSEVIGQIDTSVFSAVEWRCVGPWRGGRSCAVAGIAGEDQRFYFGATGGGVWMTDNGGKTWKNISDGYFGGSIGAIAIAPSDENVIYVGQGEQTLRGNVSSGFGVWKSEDGGQSWVHMGLDKTRHISRIRVHPDNPDIVYVAAIGNLWKNNPERGVYKSTDGGKTWRKVLYINDSVGIADLCMDPTNPRILYASSWYVRRTPYSFISGGPGSGLWKSTDGGETWENITENKGLPKGVWGISGIAASGAKRGRVWAIIENADGGLFLSDDYGKTWKRVNDDRKIRQRAWYYSRIYADPVHPNVVYVLNVHFYKSIDGGKTLQRIGTPHGDHHDLWIDPLNPDHLIIADDGGAQVSHNGGRDWTDYHNQPTGQFYRVTVDSAFPFRIYAAQQDNSTVRIRHRSYHHAITDDDWEPSAGGESAYLAPDPKDNDIVYGGSYGGFLTRYNHRLRRHRAVSVWPDNPLGYGVEAMKYRFNWNFPVFFSRHDTNKLYVCSHVVHLSTDGGETWEVISPDLTTADSSKMGPSGGPITKDNTSVEYYCTIASAAESPVKEGLLWTGSDDGKVYVRRSYASPWEDVTPKGLPPMTLINSVDPSPHDSATCTIAATAYKTGDYTPMIYRTTDFGRHWKNIAHGIPAEHFVRVVREDPEVRGLLYAGTEYGIYASWDEGRTWHSIQLNLPEVPITDMVIVGPHLVISTQGRALWIIDDLTPIRQAASVSGVRRHYLFPPKTSYRMPGGQAKNPRNAGRNHPNGAMIYYYLAKDSLTQKDTIQLCFYTSEDSLIRCFSTHAKGYRTGKLKAKAGSNLFVWDMRYPPAYKPKDMILWWSSLRGPRILPGRYRVRLIVDQDTLMRDFVVEADKNTEASFEEMKAQYDFIHQNNAVLDSMHRIIDEIRQIRESLRAVKKRVQGHPNYAQFDSLDYRIDSITRYVEESLYQTRLKSFQDPLNYPIKLNNKLAHLNALIEMNDFGPTQSMREVQQELIRKAREVFKIYERCKQRDIEALNEWLWKQRVRVVFPVVGED